MHISNVQRKWTNPKAKHRCSCHILYVAQTGRIAKTQIVRCINRNFQIPNNILTTSHFVHVEIVCFCSDPLSESRKHNLHFCIHVLPFIFRRKGIFNAWNILWSMLLDALRNLPLRTIVLAFQTEKALKQHGVEKSGRTSGRRKLLNSIWGHCRIKKKCNRTDRCSILLFCIQCWVLH